MPDVGLSDREIALMRKDSRMTPKGRWVWRWVGPWHEDDDANEGVSIAENDAIQAEHREVS